MTPAQHVCPKCRTPIRPRRRFWPRYCPQCGTRLAFANRGRAQAVRRGLLLRPARASGAVASLVFGIMSFCTPMAGFIFGLIAVIIGSHTHERIRKSHGALTGDGFATAGIVIGSISMAMWTLVCLGAI